MKKLYCIFSLLFILMVCCKKYEVEPYSGPDRLNFYNDNYAVTGDEITQSDSVTFLFFNVTPSKLRDTVWVYMSATGESTSYNRDIEIIQKNIGKEGSAISGTHFIPLSDISEYMVVEAGKIITKFPIVLLRDNSLLTETVRIDLEIVSNEYFLPGMERLSKFSIITSDYPLKSDNWDTTWKYVFGEWGYKKMIFLRDYVLGTDFDWENSFVNLDYVERVFYTDYAQEKLDEYNNNPDNKNTPLTEEDGTQVTFN